MKYGWDITMNQLASIPRYDDRRWPTLLAVSAVALVLGCEAIHTRLSAAQPGSQKATALPVGDDLPRAVPEVLFAARIIDGRGKAAGAVARYRIDGRLNGQRWSSEFRPAVGGADTVNALHQASIASISNCSPAATPMSRFADRASKAQ
jgi:hypothetical protein